MNKKELKGPDTFVSTSDKLFAWIEKHRRSVILGFGALAAVSLVYVIYGYVQASRERSATEALYTAAAELRKADAAVREERAKKMTELAAAKKKPGKEGENVRPTDFGKDFAPAVEKWSAELRRHSSTRAGLVSALELSSFLVQEKQYPAALEVLSLISFSPGEQDILGGFWLMNKGLVLMENGKFDDAASAYQTVLAAKALAAFHPEALLKLGVAYDAKGDVDKARQSYERLWREFPQTEASSSAQQYLRLLEIKKKQG